MARFRSRQLLAHIPRGDTAAIGGELTFGNLRLNLVRHEAYLADQSLALTPLEYELLAMFVRHPYEVLSREQLSEAVWQTQEVEGRSNFVEAAVMGLRRGLEATGEPRLIHTVRGYGYALRKARAPQIDLDEARRG
jgi:DNA-binding response OmpR family regulator